MRIIFFGSSEFSLPSLQACLDSKNEVLLVITTPDRKKGRGLKESPTPVKRKAQENRIPCETPETLKSPELIEKVKSLTPDLFVVASYGKLIPSAWLKIPSKLCVNVHPSLLPKYRGAAPLHWPILNGDSETGLTLAEVTDKLDAGDIFFQTRIPIPPDADSETLSRRLAHLAYDALLQLFPKIEAGAYSRTPQEESLSTYAPKLKKEDGVMNWTRSAREIHHQIRGLLPWPGASFECRGEAVWVLKSRVADPELKAAEPGEILQIGKSGAIVVQTGMGTLAVDKVKPAGKKEMSAADFARGRRLAPGASLSAS